MSLKEFMSYVFNMSEDKPIMVNDYGLLERVKDIHEESECIVIELEED